MPDVAFGIWLASESGGVQDTDPLSVPGVISSEAIPKEKRIRSVNEEDALVILIVAALPKVRDGQEILEALAMKESFKEAEPEADPYVHGSPL